MPKKTPVRIIDNRKANRATTISGVTLTAPATGVSDHGLLLGLGDDDHTQYLLADGTRTLAGNLAVAAGVTIDGVDLSAHAANASAHHAPVTAGDGIGVSGQQVAVDASVVRTGRQVIAGAGMTGGGDLSADRTLAVGAGTLIAVGADTVGLAPGAAYQFVGTGNDTVPEWRNVSELAGNGLTATNGVLAVVVANTGGADGLSVEADAVRLTSSSAPGATARVLASDASGYLSLVRLTLADRLYVPQVATLSGDLALAPATGIATIAALHAGTRVRTTLIDTAAGNLTVQPAADLMLSPGSNLVKLPTGKSLQSDGYASQATGMRVTAAGEGDFRYLFVDEMHAKSFVADLEQALAGGQIISKSVAVLALDFTLPAAGSAGTLRVRDLPSAPNMAVFQSGDFAGLRQFSRSAGSLTIGWAWGTVTAYADQSDGTQTWTFTRHASTPGAASGTIAADSLVLDFGVTGNGYYEVNAIDGAYGANSPYWRIVTWATHPATQTVRVQGGNLRGLFGVANEYGFYAGDGTGTGNSFVRLSSQTNEFRNLTASWYSGGSVIIQVDPTNGIGVATTPALSIQRGYAFIGESVRSGGLFARNDTAENEVLLSANIGFGTNGAWQPAIASRDALATVGAYASGSGKFARITLVARSDYGDTTMIMRSENGLMRTEFPGTVTVGAFAAPVTISSPTSAGVALTVGRIVGNASIKSGADWLIMDSNISPAAINYYVAQDVLLAYGGGDVGIGTASPARKLHVAGSIVVDGDEGGVAGAITLTDVSNMSLSTGTGTIKMSGSANATSSGWVKIYIGTTSYYIPVFQAIAG